MSDAHCIIVGGSHAAANLLPQLRNGGWDGPITIVSADKQHPYHRPPLSKAFLSGEKAAGDILIRPAAFYEKAQADVLLGTRVTAIDRAASTVSLDDGRTLAYDKLALATGARVRTLPIPGADLDGVLYLRDLADAEALKQRAAPGKSAVIIGGGYIGLEAAASLRALGLNVTVLEAMPRILQRVTTAETSDFFSRVHREEGVDIITDAQVVAIEGAGDVTGVTLGSGETVAADIVLIGIGVIPNTELAETAGLVVDNGIQVDEFARTSDHNIVAAGDCTRHFNPLYHRWIRLESVQNATDQARVAANTLNGVLEPYAALPWFWSDQYDLKLQIAGLCEEHDRVVIRGSSTEGRSFCAFYFAGDRLLAADAINQPREFMAIRKALAAGKSADPAVLADPDSDLATAFS